MVAVDTHEIHYILSGLYWFKNNPVVHFMSYFYLKIVFIKVLKVQVSQLVKFHDIGGGQSCFLPPYNLS